MAIQKSLAQQAIDATMRKFLILFVLVGLAAGLSSAATASTYALSVSAQSNHSGAVALNGSTVSGNVYVFTSMASQLTNIDPSGIARVCYWLDNAAMSGTATHCEGVMPYDFAGSADNTATSLANAWNTGSVASGSHTITQFVTMASGATETDTATFKTGTATAPAPVPVVSISISPTSSSLKTGATQQFGSTVSGSTNTSVTWLVNGVTGGNPTTGTISTSGLYTAPATVPSGTITVTAKSVADTTKSANATMTVSAPAPTSGTYALSVSTQSSRNGGTGLNGATISGTDYVFTSMASALSNYNPTGITQVCYWLDNTAMSGTATHCEGVVPYDFAGTSSNVSIANPWSTTGLANGTHTITQKVTMTSGATETDIATFKINTVASALSISTGSLSGGTANSAYSATLAATGGTSPYTWSISSGSLGAGLTLSSSGTISGKPTTAGTYTFTAQVKDSSATAKIATKSLSLTVAAAPSAPALSITTASVAGATVKVAYSTTLAATGGTSPYTWSISGALPSGVSMSSTGVISGTPTATGSFAFTAQVADNAGHTASKAETLTVAAAPVPPTGSTKFFAPSSFINTPLPASPSVDPNSASMVANSLVAQASAAHLSNASYGVGLVYSSAGNKVYSVACTTYDSNTCLVGSSINFPIPAGAQVPSGTDHNTAFIYTAQDGSPYAGMELDCWIAQYNSANDTWSCGTASLVHNNSTNAWGTCAEGNVTSFHCNGGYAAGFDFGAGPIRPEEIAAGQINHALVVALSNPGSGITCPATHTDHSGSGIPEGGHFFLPKSFNVAAAASAGGWPSWVTTIAYALQNYGGYIVDYGGSFEVKGFTDQNPGSITWSSVGVPLDGYSTLAVLPWNQMQVVTMQSCN